MKRYGYNLDATHQAMIYEVGTEAADDCVHSGDTPGLIIGTTEYGWVSEDDARRICAALTFFSTMDTNLIEQLAARRLTE